MCLKLCFVYKSVSDISLTPLRHIVRVPEINDIIIRHPWNMIYFLVYLDRNTLLNYSTLG